MFFIIKKLFKDWAIRFILSFIFAWVCDRTVTPARDFIFLQLENNGYFFVGECKKMSWKELINKTIDAKNVLVIYKELPTTDHVFYYAKRDDYCPYLRLMHYGAEYLLKLENSSMSFNNPEEYQRRKEILKKNLRIYDLMDDLRREYIELYRKRVKLMELKELTGSKDYYDIKVPHIVPPDFIPLNPD